MTYIPAAIRKELLAVASVITEHFNAGDWLSLGLVTGSDDLIRGHDRLLRSLRFGDDDYPGHAHIVLHQIVERELENFDLIKNYVAERYGVAGNSISTAPSRGTPIIFTPSVFEVPDGGTEADLVAVMMPFAAEFDPVFGAIRLACQRAGLRSLRAKDIWEHSTVIQDVFSLIYRAAVVICDFSGRNPNVFYEAGIAHTLGKQVVPLTQAAGDIPFDIAHHRFLAYLNNGEGLAALATNLDRRLRKLTDSKFADRPPRFAADEALLNKLKAALRISDVIGRKVALRKQGREFVGLSPFTDEKTPSFYVNDEKGQFFDFATGKTGDVIEFLKATGELNDATIVELAGQVGIALPSVAQDSEPTWVGLTS